MSKRPLSLAGAFVAVLALGDGATPAYAAPTSVANVSVDLTLFGSLLVFVAGTLLFYTLHLRARLRRSSERLARASAEWTQAMDVLPDSTYLVDLNDRLVRANRAFYQQIGRTPEEALGRDVRSLVHLRPEKVACPICAARMELRDAFFTKEADDPSNPTGRPMEITVRVIRDEAGNPIGVIQALRDMSHLRTAEEALRISQARLAEAQRIAHLGNWDWNLETNVLVWSDEVYSIFGQTPESFKPTYDNFMMLVHPEDRVLVKHAVTNALTDPANRSYQIQHRFYLSNGAERVAHEEGRVYCGPNRKPVRMIGIVQDITERKRAEEALRQEKDRAQVTLQSIGDAVITTDEQGTIDEVNPAALHLLGTQTDSVLGRHYGEVLHLIDEQHERPLEDPIARCLDGYNKVVHEDSLLLLREDNEVPVQLTAAVIRGRSDSILGAAVVLRDITEMRGMARQLSHQATHDMLTGLVNRAEFEIRLQQALESARVDNKEHALVYLDLDQFKVINDTCGHIAGDELLKQVAVLLLAGVRNVDTLARLGGDEFAILLEACPLDAAQRIANNLRQRIKDLRFAWEDKVFEIGASFGLVPVSADSGSQVDLLRAADSACYVAKGNGRNRVHTSLPNDRELANHHGQMHWVHRITHALDQGRFDLYCQPIVPLGGRKDGFRHFEILLRMLDREGNIVLPGAFIPAAERYQLMPAVDRWVIRNTFAALRIVREETQQDCFACMVNLSGQSLGDEAILSDVIGAMETSGISPDCVCFELTETAAVTNLTNARNFISALKELGVRFALDDFGSGLSSFGYLKTLAIDYIKIDGSFVKDIVDDPLDRAMVRSINEIGHLMGIQTIAESVEDQATLDLLLEIGLDFAQGYHVGPPKSLINIVRTPFIGRGATDQATPDQSRIPGEKDDRRSMT